MPEMPREVEVERVLNLVRGFGWEKVKDEIVGDDLTITIKKRYFKPGEAPGSVTPT
jgi:hypothetical protein